MDANSSPNYEEQERRLDALAGRNDELRRLLADAYRQLEELEHKRGRLRRFAGGAHSRARRALRARAPRLARLYRDLRVRLG